MSEQILYEASPSMFRNQPIGFFLTLLLSLVGIGLIIFFFWWLDCLGTKLTVTDRRTTLRKGVFSKHVTEVWHRDVRTVSLSQSFTQRILGVGTIGISSAGQGDVEISVAGLPNPEDIKSAIDSRRVG